jgi:hypothetical protein
MAAFGSFWHFLVNGKLLESANVKRPTHKEHQEEYEQHCDDRFAIAISGVCFDVLQIRIQVTNFVPKICAASGLFISGISNQVPSHCLPPLED